MIDVSVKADINSRELKQLVHKANKKAMYKSSMLATKMARQKIRYRSYRMSSRPGRPPFKHSTGSRSFSHSIRFAVDSAGTTAVIGPQRESKQLNPSGPVPRTLEFGGRTRRGRNTMWFVRRDVPWGASSKKQVADYFRKEGWGPLYMGTNQMQVSRRAGNRPVLSKKVPDPKSPGKYKLVYYFAIPIRSEKQAEIAADNVVKYFGYPTTAANTIAPRPFMGPTLQENGGKIMSFWKNII